MKQSSIEFLLDLKVDEDSNGNDIKVKDIIVDSGIKKAKEIHNQEIIDSHKDGGIFFTEPSRQERAEDYYQKTYK